MPSFALVRAETRETMDWLKGKTRETMDYNDYILWESNVAMENGTFIVDSHRNHGFYHGFSREIR
jgi:hypothetical protein